MRGLSEAEAEVLDCAMGVLRRLAKVTNARQVSAFVRPDGTVQIYGNDDFVTTWIAMAHLEPDGDAPLPSRAVASALLRVGEDGKP